MSFWSEWVSVHCIYISYYWSTARKTRLAPTRDAPETKSMIWIDRGSKSFMLRCTPTCNLCHFLAPPLLPKLILKAQSLKESTAQQACCLHRLAQLQCSTLIQPLLLQFFSPFFCNQDAAWLVVKRNLTWKYFTNQCVLLYIHRETAASLYSCAANFKGRRVCILHLLVDNLASRPLMLQSKGQ